MTSNDMREPVYSPEASDNQNFGDWQSKVMLTIYILILFGVVYAIAKHLGL